MRFLPLNLPDRTASESGNRPADYVEGTERSALLLRLAGGLQRRPERILEVGCNVGRNLQYLREAGYRGLMRNDRTIIPGAVNKMLTLAIRVVPRRLLLRAVDSRQSRRRSAQQT